MNIDKKIDACWRLITARLRAFDLRPLAASIHWKGWA